MKTYTVLDLINMDKKSLSNVQQQLNQALNLSLEDKRFLNDVKLIAIAQESINNLSKIIGLRIGSVEISREIDSLYDEAIKIIDQAIIQLTPAEMTTWKNFNNVIEGNLRHN